MFWLITAISLVLFIAGLYIDYGLHQGWGLLVGLLGLGGFWFAYVRSPYHLWRLIDLEMIKSEFEEALKLSDKLIQTHPMNCAGHLLRATSNAALFRFSDADKDCKNGLSLPNLKPSEQGPFHALSCYIAAARNDEVGLEDAADRMFKTAPDSPLCLLHYSNSLLLLGRVEAAKPYLQKLELGCRKEPVRFEVFMHANWALLEMLEGNFTEAERRLEIALRLWPEYPGFLSIRGICRLMQGLPQESIADFSKAIDGNKNAINAYWFRHLAYKRLGNPEAAEADLAVATGGGFVPPLAFQNLK